ncbi:sensor histidine kinase [Variovorax terrae]|uniref:histidine kinase n=1 Tax=Variovorax terrae TaxID=2923278 RepID=A0A9X1VRD6_9BURK|nr:ATP-binding protein [Variovorax terrae]MCJ0761995.1 histidine kinase [Variovorax terrae]
MNFRAIKAGGWLLFLWLALALGARAEIQELRQARAAITVDGTTELTTVALPYHWDRHHPGQQGIATFEVAFSMPGEPAVPYAVYFPRLGNAYEIWLNGTLLQRNGDLARFNSSDYGKAPRYVEVPPQLLQKQNLFRINIRADGGRRGGLAAPVVGPDEDVRELYVADYRWQVAGSLAVVVLSLLVGIVALMLWLTQSDPAQRGWRKRDSLYLYAGLAELAWALRIGDKLIENPPMSWLGWGPLMTACAACWLCSMALFCVKVAGWDDRSRLGWWKGGLLLFFLAGTVIGVAAQYGHQPLLLTTYYAVASAWCIPFALVYMARAVRPGARRAHVLVALALLANVLTGLRDLVVFRMSDSFGDNSWLRYSSMLFGLMLGYIAITRFRAASVQVRDLMANLAARVAQKEAELAQTYQRVEQLAREQERASERSRILRDMHDGVGSHISAAIRQLQSGRASNEAVLLTLRDSLDQLKLSIDAMNLPAGDVTALLANLRYRLEPRFAASDIELQWDVDLLDPLQGLDAGAMRQLQFMVFEALSNVLQHAQASVLRIEARVAGAQVHLRLIDNGRGFDTTRPPRKGLLSLRERAQAIGAALVIRSAGGGTEVEIRLPG